jgi:hypothetical protein
MLRTLHENINSDSTTVNALFAVTLTPAHPHHQAPTFPPLHNPRKRSRECVEYFTYCENGSNTAGRITRSILC